GCGDCLTRPLRLYQHHLLGHARQQPREEIPGEIAPLAMLEIGGLVKQVELIQYRLRHLRTFEPAKADALRLNAGALLAHVLALARDKPLKKFIEGRTAGVLP